MCCVVLQQYSSLIHHISRLNVEIANAMTQSRFAAVCHSGRPKHTSDCSNSAVLGAPSVSNKTWELNVSTLTSNDGSYLH